VGLDDSRLESLRVAADAWRHSTGPRRRVVDQVCLVPDVPSFLEAISFWDERQFFPILIDSPAWVLPFLRAFRPARVIRFARSASPTAVSALTEAQSRGMSSDAVWQSALRALTKAWSRPPVSAAPGAADTDGSAAQSTRGPPGLVLTAAESPMFAGAIALAAGRFQGILRVEPPASGRTRSDGLDRAARLDDVLSLEDAWQFAKEIEARVAVAGVKYDKLGDDCDFLTLAGDWPYRYRVERARGTARGIYALDDLIGRRLDPDGEDWMERTRHRWAYVGRLLGDPPSSVARAMAALFLQPTSVLLWNTFDGGMPWSDYEMSRAAGRLRGNLMVPEAVEHRGGRRANLTSWHRVVSPFNRFGLVLVNSSGGPRQFAIEGGPGRPADLPPGLPVIVSMIHSFSAADLTDQETIAGRWLAQGAYVFYGSVNEPFLAAFRRPVLVADLLAAGIPFVAALRQGEFEAFGHPWRLIYLGDPLYRFDNYRINERSDHSREAGQRLSFDEWRKVTLADANWRVVEVTTQVLPPRESSPRHDSRPDTDTDATRLAWCMEAALAESTAGSGNHNTTPPSPGLVGEQQPLDWRSSLRSIDRKRLDRKLRSMFDELLIDAIRELDSDEELQSRLLRIPDSEKSSRVWQAIETGAAARLARLDLDPDRSRGFRRALDLWNELIQLSWPRGSAFPGQLTERITAMASADAAMRMRPWLNRLRVTASELSARSDEFPHADVVGAERVRVEKKIGQGLRW